jgi:PiT family inorganic phosphate transporter
METILLTFSVCFLAYSNGANDNFKGVASLFGCGAANYQLALLWATITTLAGSICALFLAQTLLIKFSGKGLAPDTLIHTLSFMIAVASGAGLTIILATRLGFPISTTHALLGAMAGSTLIATLGDLNWSALQSNFILPLFLSPIVSVLLAMAVYSALRQIKKNTTISEALCLCTENEPMMSGALLISNSETHALQGDTELAYTVDNQAACINRNANVVLGIDVQCVLDGLHFISAGAVCFARGLNDTPKIAALLLLAPSFRMQKIIVLIAITMALGGLLNARRIAETMSHRITEISHGQGLSANITTAFLVIFASKLGMPVSTTHVSVGALFGIGLVNQKANTRMMASILLSWVLTLPCAALCAAGIYTLNNKVF